jgi:hypothetical protein
MNLFRKPKHAGGIEKAVLKTPHSRRFARFLR